MTEKRKPARLLDKKPGNLVENWREKLNNWLKTKVDKKLLDQKKKTNFL